MNLNFQTERRNIIAYELMEVSLVIYEILILLIINNNVLK